MLLAVPPYFRVLMTLHSFMCIRSATRTSNLAHLPGKCFSSEDSHTEISKRFAWNALSRWHFISASLHLLYLHMFIVYNQKYYCINTYICQRRDFLDSFEKFSLPFKTGRLTWKSKFQCKSKFHRDLNFVDLTRDFWTTSLVFCYN